MKILTFFICLIAIQNLFANEKWVSVSLGAFSNTKRVFRGAEYYPDMTLFAGPAFTFFDQFQLRGPSLSWSPHSRRAKQQFTLGLNYLNDGAPPLEIFGDFDEKTDYRASRSDAWEFSARYKYNFGFRDLFGIDLFVAKELNRHYGEYFEFSFIAPVYKFVSLRLLAGYGSREHNEYLYGITAKKGATHHQVNLNYMIRQLSWCDLMFLEGSSSWIQQRENRNAPLVRGHHNQNVFSVRTIWLL